MYEFKRVYLVFKKVRKRFWYEIESVLLEDFEILYKKELYVSVFYRFQESIQMDVEYLVDVMRDLIICN